MSAAVIDIAAPETVDAAWEAYRVLAARLRHEPELLIDRGFMEEMKRAERKWTRLFNMMDGK